jgi:intracellular septation protein A
MAAMAVQAVVVCGLLLVGLQAQELVLLDREILEEIQAAVFLVAAVAKERRLVVEMVEMEVLSF